MVPQHLAFGPFVLDRQRAVLMREGLAVAASHKGLCLLQALLEAPGQVQRKETLMRAAWPDAVVEDSNLTVQIAMLRKLLGTQPDGSEWIVTVPRVGYRFVGRVTVSGAGGQSSSTAGDDAGSAAGASIVVLPLANVSRSREQEYLADGITEDIIAALTRFRWFRVIGRNTSFVYKGQSVDARQLARDLGVRYVLEGSVRRSGRRLRISAQLVDAASASEIWAERFEILLQDGFAVQDAIAERVVGAIEPELLKTAGRPESARRGGDVTSWDLVRQGTWLFHHVDRHDHAKARALFRQARELDPESAEAHIWVARVSAGLVAYGWSEDPVRDIQEGLDAGSKAIRLDERNPYSHYALAICSAYVGSPEETVLAAERAVELSPSFALGHLVCGMGHLFGGSANDAAAALARGLALNRHDPQNFIWYHLLALAWLFAGRADEAVEAALRGRTVRPDWRPIHRMLACSYAALGQMQRAAESARKLRELDEPPGDAIGPLGLRRPDWVAQLATLLRQVEGERPTS